MLPGMGHNLCASCVSVGFPHRLHIPGHPSITRHDAFLPSTGLHVPAAAGRQYTHCARPGGSVRRWHLTQTPKAAAGLFFAGGAGCGILSAPGFPFSVSALPSAALFRDIPDTAPVQGPHLCNPQVGHIPCALYHSYFVTACFTSFAALCIFPGLVTGAPSARLHYGGARWPRLFFLFFAPGKELIAVIPVFK